jgi:hypothetical protein
MKKRGNVFPLGEGWGEVKPVRVPAQLTLTPLPLGEGKFSLT